MPEKKTVLRLVYTPIFDRTTDGRCRATYPGWETLVAGYGDSEDQALDNLKSEVDQKMGDPEFRAATARIDTAMLQNPTSGVLAEEITLDEYDDKIRHAIESGDPIHSDPRPIGKDR